MTSDDVDTQFMLNPFHKDYIKMKSKIDSQVYFVKMPNATFHRRLDIYELLILFHIHLVQSFLS